MSKYVKTNLQNFLNENHELSKQILIDIANELAEKLHCDKHGSCVHFAELFVEKVNQENPELLNIIFVIEGYVNWKVSEGIPQEHTWIELKDGTKIDPTFIQFSNLGEASYLKKIFKKYTGLEYLRDSGGIWFEERRKEFPHYVFKDLN